MAKSRYPTRSRSSLRERCQVELVLNKRLFVLHRDWNTPKNISNDIFLEFEPEPEDDKPNSRRKIPVPLCSERRMRSLACKSHVFGFMPGLYIAMMDNEEDVPALCMSGYRAFTHVVQISYSTRASPASSDRRWEEAPLNDSVNRLRLICPESALKLRADHTAITPRELRAARDFLSLALPYGSEKWWPENARRGEQSEEVYPYQQDECEDAKDEQEEENVAVDKDAQFVDLPADMRWLDALLDKIPLRRDSGEGDGGMKVNVLITAPKRRAIDVLSVLFCYVAFLYDALPDSVVNRNKQYDDRLWRKVELAPWSRDYVELMSMLA